MNKQCITRASTISIFVLALVSGQRASGQVQILTLNEMLELVDAQNLMLAESESKVKGLHAYTEGARSWMAPMVGFGPFWYPYPGETLMSEAEKGMLMASVEQDIPNPAKLKGKKEYLASRVKIEEESRAVQLNQLRTETKTYYYQWLVSEKKKTVLRENIEIAEMMLKIARIRYPYNQGTLGSIYKAEARQHEVENMLAMATGNIEESNFRLKSLMNLDPDDSIMIDTATVVAFQNNELGLDTAGLGARRHDVRQMERTIESMKLNQRLQGMAAKPDFKIRFEHMSPRGEGMPQQFSAMAMVTIPIAPWSSKMYKAETKGMQYEIEGMKKARQALLVETMGMLQGMRRQLIRMDQQLESYQTKIIPALQRNLNGLMVAYEENREQLPMVIDAWEAVNMAQMTHLEKLEDYYKMIVSYENELYQ